MTKKIWMLQFPILLFFSLCFWVVELGYQGKLESAFLREKIYPILIRAENVFTDLKFKARGPVKSKNKIVIVEIDSHAIELLGRWPWHRDTMAVLIDKTFRAGAKVVGLDMVFSEPDTRISPELAEFLKSKKVGSLDQFETDIDLGTVVRQYSDQLVLGWASVEECQPLYSGGQECPFDDPTATEAFPKDFDKFSFDDWKTQTPFDPKKTASISYFSPILNIPLYHQAAKHLGYVNVDPDSDGYIRRTNLVAFAQGKPYMSLALAMAKAGLHEKVRLELGASQRVKKIELEGAGRSLSVTPVGALQINFRGPRSSFRRVSAIDVLKEAPTVMDLADAQAANLNKEEVFKDAYVFIGLSAVGVHDMRQFPFESNEPGVDGHANILDNILSGDPLTSGSDGVGFWLILFVMVFGVGVFSVVLQRLQAVPSLLLFVATFLILLVVDFNLVFKRNYNLNTVFVYLELIVIFIVALASKYILEEQNKKFIRGAFAKFVAPTVVDSILLDPSKLAIGGEKKDLTILFSDIRNFTSFSEKLDAKVLSSFLNEYFTIMTQILFRHQGTLDKYIGDAVMAFWGAPLSDLNHASNSCKAAIEMIEALEKNQSRFKSQYGIDVEIGIGINSGVVSVGNMGSEQNFGYTVLGDQVNLASRVEGLTKEYRVKILTTRFTFESMQPEQRQGVQFRVLDDVKVKGKNKAVELLQILHRPLSESVLKAFAEGRELYRAQKFTEALGKFSEASKLASGDGPSEMFIERCQFFQQKPPGENWDGSWEMHSK